MPEKNRLATAFASVLTSLNAAAAVSEPVHALNFVRAETDQYFARYVDLGGFGQVYHVRDPVRIDAQDVIRMNRDTLYSFGVFDLTEPVTITKPDPDGRFQSMLVIDQDHYVVALEHDAGAFTFERDSVGTRYVIAIFRTFMDPQDGADVDAANALQDAIVVEQADAGAFEVPDWDVTSLARTRNGLLALAAEAPQNADGAFGARDEVDPILHFFATAAGWGGNPREAAMYTSFYPAPGDAMTPHALTVPAEVPVEGFWSVTLYNSDGYMVQNDLEAYSVNTVTADPNADGSVTVHFGGCDDGRVNCLPIVEGWNYTVRLYRPRAEILDRSWTFPEAAPVD